MRTRLIILFSLFCLQSHAQQKTVFKEITPVFAHNNSFEAVGERLIRKGKLTSFTELSERKKRRMMRIAKRDRNLDREKPLVIYVDMDGASPDDSKYLYFVWGYEK